MSFLLSLLTLLASGGLPVRVTPVSGSPYDADLLGVNEKTFQMRVGEEEKSVAYDDLQAIKRRGDAPSGSPRLRVQLRDGSRLAGDEVTVADDQATIELRRQAALKVPVSQLRWIRFQPATPAVEAQWLGMLDREAPNDTLVIRREGDNLDRVGGIVRGIDQTAVAFTLDGQPLDAPRERLEGVLFGGEDRIPEAPAIRLTDTYGSEWHLAELRPGSDDGTLTAVLVGGRTHEVPTELIDKIELASSVEFLAASDAVHSEYQPHIGAPAGVEILSEWLQPHAHDDRDLVMRSRSSIEYRVEPGFQKFISSLAIDPSVEQGGSCDIRLLVDGKLSWEQSLSVNGEPLGVELPLQNARRIRIEVDYGGDGDVGDVVRFHQPRLIK